MAQVALWLPDLRPPVDWLLDSILYDDAFATIAPRWKLDLIEEGVLLEDLGREGLYRPVQVKDALDTQVCRDLITNLRVSAEAIEQLGRHDPDVSAWSITRRLAMSDAAVRQRYEEANDRVRSLASSEKQPAPTLTEQERLARIAARDRSRRLQQLLRETRQARDQSASEIEALRAADREFSLTYPDAFVQTPPVPDSAALQGARRALASAKRPVERLREAGQTCWHRCVTPGRFDSKDHFYDYLYAAKVPPDLLDPLTAEVGLIQHRVKWETYLFGPRPLIQDAIRLLGAAWLARNEGLPDTYIPAKRLPSHDQDLGDAPLVHALRAKLPRPAAGADPRLVLEFRLKHEKKLAKLRADLKELAASPNHERHLDTLGRQVDTAITKTADDLHRKFPSVHEAVRTVRHAPVSLATGLALDISVAAAVPQWTFQFATATVAAGLLGHTLAGLHAAYVERGARTTLDYVYEARQFGIPFGR